MTVVDLRDVSRAQDLMRSQVIGAGKHSCTNAVTAGQTPERVSQTHDVRELSADRITSRTGQQFPSSARADADYHRDGKCCETAG
jgi:hypothetical protein